MMHSFFVLTLNVYVLVNCVHFFKGNVVLHLHIIQTVYSNYAL